MTAFPIFCLFCPIAVKARLITKSANAVGGGWALQDSSNRNRRDSPVTAFRGRSVDWTQSGRWAWVAGTALRAPMRTLAYLESNPIDT